LVKRDYKVKQHTVTEKVCVKETLVCDICRKEIPYKKGYWHLVTQHNDWGNDSVDSVESFDICSKDCMDKKYNEYMNDSGKDDYNTMEFEMSREFNSYGKEQ
jgi:hypothetical protein